jgi:hypothetical protein
MPRRCEGKKQKNANNHKEKYDKTCLLYSYLLRMRDGISLAIIDGCIRDGTARGEICHRDECFMIIPFLNTEMSEMKPGDRRI